MPVSYDHLKFITQRYDTYISGANTKGAFLLAFNTFLCGGLLSNYNTIIKLVNVCHLVYLEGGLVLILITGVVSLVIILLAVYPFLKSGNSSPNKYHSLIYFGSVSSFETADKYAEAVSKQDEQETYNDLSKQIYQLSKALLKKYNLLAWATRLTFFQLAMVVGCILLTIL
jgi:hypothetical protein